MVKNSMISMTLACLLSSSETAAKEKRLLTPSFKHYHQEPMIENYKKKNPPVTKAEKHCGHMV
jgi:hypothetical protein